MRRLAVGILVATALASGAAQLPAQHSGQFEVGAFGAYTRYDAAFKLPNKIGGGARIGYFIGDRIGLEGDVVFQQEYQVTPSGTPVTIEPMIASASLIVNLLHPSRLGVYVLGGYSRLDFGTRSPYQFTDNAGHAGAGARLFLSDRVSIQGEARVLYTPSTQSSFGPSNVKHYVATVGFSVLHLGPTPTKVAAAPPPCPNPPKGAVLDAKGCPIEAPHDTVAPPPPPPCVLAPPGAKADANGCVLPAEAQAPPPLPSCPVPPPGAKVDANGCALPTEEAVKPAEPPPPPPPPPPPAPPKCPPAPPGSRVDANGCLILFTPDSARPAAPGAPPRPTLILRGVNFELAKSALTRDSYAVLDAVAASLVANPEIRIEIAGYTDITGLKYRNLLLSQARAAAVRAYLARKGVLPSRMVTKGYGATGFIATNTTADGRAQNRRVELHKLP